MSSVYFRAGRDMPSRRPLPLLPIAENDNEGLMEIEPDHEHTTLEAPSWEPTTQRTSTVVKPKPMLPLYPACRTRRRTLSSQAYKIPPTIDESPEHELALVPFPTSTTVDDDIPLIDLTGDDESLPLPTQPTLRKRRRTPTFTILDFEAEAEEEEERLPTPVETEKEEPSVAMSEETVEEDFIPLSPASVAQFSAMPDFDEVPLIDFDSDLVVDAQPEEEQEDDDELSIPDVYQSSLLSEELPSDLPELDDSDLFFGSESDSDSELASPIISTPPLRVHVFTSSSDLSQSHLPIVPPVLDRLSALTSPVVRGVVRSPSPLALPPSSTSSNMPLSVPRIVTPPPRPGSPIAEIMARSRTDSTTSHSASENPTSPSTPTLKHPHEMSTSLLSPISPIYNLSPSSPSPLSSPWARNLPPRMFDVFVGAETEYQRLRKLVDSPSAYDTRDDEGTDTGAYDSDRTVRQSDYLPASGRGRMRRGSLFGSTERPMVWRSRREVFHM